jgi:hypothetical protein
MDGVAIPAIDTSRAEVDPGDQAVDRVQPSLLVSCLSGSLASTAETAQAIASLRITVCGAPR